MAAMHQPMSRRHHGYLLAKPSAPAAGDQEQHLYIHKCTSVVTPAALARPATYVRSAMMVMGYFRSSSKSAITSSSASASASAGGKSKKKAKKNGCAPAAHEEAAGLRESLLDQPATAAAEGGVPKGYFAVYAGEESRRFLVPTGYLREPAFRDLMERAADEFGFAQAGGLRVPCAEEDFEDLLRRLHRKNGHSGAAGKGKKPAVVGR